MSAVLAPPRPLKWGNTAQMNVDAGVKMLTYGDSGAGKTYLISTAPTPIVASAESGLLSLRKFNIPYAEINSVEDLTQFYNWCAGAAEARQFQTVCLDSLSEIAEQILANALKGASDPRQGYLAVVQQTIMLVRAFRELRTHHVYMSAKMAPVKDGDGVIRNWPDMPGSKLGFKLPYYFDEVFFIGTHKDDKTQQSYRYIQTAQDLRNTAKDRSGALAPYEQPDLTMIINKILQGA